MTVYLDVSSNVHPFGCDGPGRCVHCDRRHVASSHDPAVCALCDPEYDMQPNGYYDERGERERRSA